MTIREAAERVLFAESLEEKVALGAATASDQAREPGLSTPVAPGRPPGLALRSERDAAKARFPGTHRLEDERQRGLLLHFLANHELLAAELMALVLLKFPDAPGGFRSGVYETMREEQVHVQLYLRRMRECGVHFGELPVSGYFWRTIAPVSSPMEFVSRLSLTFEQANLDFSKHYAGLFRAAGDGATAAVLEKIYEDEIRHVGHGLHWFRQWKDPEQSDWEAFRKSFSFPLSPARAKGVAVPFNEAGRLSAGLDEAFISELRLAQQSRGRTPVVHWFNPNAEWQARPTRSKRTLNQFARALEEDLELLMLGACRQDDVLVVRRPPSREHLARLRNDGFSLPEILPVENLPDLGDRKLGGFRPWAWSRDASDLFASLADRVSANLPAPWQKPVPPLWLSKEIGLQLEEQLGLKHGRLCRSIEEAMEAAGQGPSLFKALHDCAGRGHHRACLGSSLDSQRAWLESALRKNGGVVVEPWLDRVTDFSASYEIGLNGSVVFLGLTQIENDATGRFSGIRVGERWNRLFPDEVEAFLFREAEVMTWYRERIPTMLPKLLPGYRGPVGVDAMVHRVEGGKLALRPVVEVNARLTMGRIAKELLRRSTPQQEGHLRILKKDQWDGREWTLNDPSRAKEFVATWSIG